VSVAASTPGLITVRVRYTAFWSVASGLGCVGPAPDGWTTVDAYQPGTIQLSAVLGSASKTTCAQITSG
jgi:hypothetical protein